MSDESNKAPQGPGKVQPDLPPGAMVPKHGHGFLKPVVKGEIRNPTGRTGEYQRCIRLCRERSYAAAETMDGLRKSSADERVQFMAAAWIYERAWGKPKEYDERELGEGRVVLDLAKLPRDLLLAILQATQMGAVKPAEAEGEAVVVQGGDATPNP